MSVKMHVSPANPVVAGTINLSLKRLTPATKPDVSEAQLRRFLHLYCLSYAIPPHALPESRAKERCLLNDDFNRKGKTVKPSVAVQVSKVNII